MSPQSIIPIILLKTKSEPNDVYEEYFSHSLESSENTRTAKTNTVPESEHESKSTSDESFKIETTKTPVINGNDEPTDVRFKPVFAPVLEHRFHEEHLKNLEGLLRSGSLAEKYGGMIFTSQQAVRAWGMVLSRVDADGRGGGLGKDDGGGEVGDEDPSHPTSRPTKTLPIPDRKDPKPPSNFEPDIPFPIYTVGPATSRSLTSLIITTHQKSPNSNFTKLDPQVLGSSTGNGASLAQYILSHYNGLHSHRKFTFHDAPRLPFVPLVGNERDTIQSGTSAEKKPLLFLVGETRRDIIPRTLLDEEGKLESGLEIGVVEVKVYRTEVMESFEGDLKVILQGIDGGELLKREGLSKKEANNSQPGTIVSTTGQPKDHISTPEAGTNTNIDTVTNTNTNSTNASTTPHNPKTTVILVVFSPQACSTLLSVLGIFNTETNQLTNYGMKWSYSPSATEPQSQSQSGPQPEHHTPQSQIFQPQNSTSQPQTTTPQSQPKAQHQPSNNQNPQSHSESPSKLTQFPSLIAQVPSKNKDSLQMKQPYQNLDIIITTIGPTTRDHLRAEFNIDPDVSALKPSPEGIRNGIVDFLKWRGKILKE